MITTTFYQHWQDVPKGAWRWPNFSPAEIACRGTGKLLVNEAALDRLQALRDRVGKPFIIRSDYRSPEHNRAVGGAPHSKHMLGEAFDIAMTNHEPVAFEAAAREDASRSRRRGWHTRDAILPLVLFLRRAGERAGRMAERLETMERSNEVHRRMLRARLAGLILATIWLAACPTGSSETLVVACPPIIEYSPKFQAGAADELALLPDEAALATMLGDYGISRGACDRAPRSPRHVAAFPAPGGNRTRSAVPPSSTPDASGEPFRAKHVRLESRGGS